MPDQVEPTAGRTFPWMEIVGPAFTAVGVVLALLPLSWAMQLVPLSENSSFFHTAYRAMFPCLLIGVSVLGAAAHKHRIEGIFLTSAAGLSTLMIYKGHLGTGLAVLIPVVAWAVAYVSRRNASRISADITSAPEANKASRIIVITAILIPLSLLILAVVLFAWVFSHLTPVH